MESLTSKASALRWLWLSAVVILLDLGTKYLADTRLTYADPVSILPVFDLTLLYNKGAAFSFLAAEGGWQRWLFILIALGVSLMLLVWMKRTPARAWWLGSGLSLLLGGALGNLYDRIVHGHVVDFISVHYGGWYFPAFNLADTAITCGAILLIIDMLFAGDQSAKESGK